MYERFTDNARRAMRRANEASLDCKVEYIGTEHILLGVMNIIGSHAIDLMNLHHPGTSSAVYEQLLKDMPPKGNVPLEGKMPQTPRAKKVIEFAMDCARELNHDYVGEEHLLAGLLKEEEGIAAKVLRDLGMTYDLVKGKIAVYAPLMRPVKNLGDAPYFDVPMDLSFEKSLSWLIVEIKKRGFTSLKEVRVLGDIAKS
jgi:ATP-dependent Clp protease ATP-binding subunit ClpC